MAFVLFCHQQHSFCFVLASTARLLFCPGINHTESLLRSAHSINSSWLGLGLARTHPLSEQWLLDLAIFFIFERLGFGRLWLNEKHILWQGHLSVQSGTELWGLLSRQVEWHQQHGFCIVLSSTAWILFCSGIDNMAFVLFRHQQRRGPLHEILAHVHRGI